MRNLMTTLQCLTFIWAVSILSSCGGQERPNKIVEQKQVSFNIETLPDLKKIVNSIEKGNGVESSHLGKGGIPSKQWAKYEKLKKVATNDQLIALTDHKNPAVRCYAFQALASKRSDKIFPILLKHLNDTSRVSIQRTCVLMTQYVGDYFVDLVTPNSFEVDICKLNQTERKTLDSILLNDTSIMLSAKSSVLESLKPTAENRQELDN
jgi:hypothetical protein